jgi:oligosaccharide repeat unit polymerase
VQSFLRLNKTLVSPLVVFCGAWAFTALLSQFHVLHSPSTWPTVMVGVVAAVPFAFVGGGLIGEGLAVRFTRTEAQGRAPAKSTHVFRVVLCIFLFLGLAELAHQFAKIGGIPLLSPNGNVIRFNQGGPTIVLTDLLTVAAIAALVRPANLLARESRFELVVALVALGGFALQAGRGSVVLPVIVATVARWLYWGRPKAWMLSGAGLIAFAAIVFGFYLRTRQSPYNPFESELYGEVLPGTPLILQPLIPIYLALTTNFLALQGIVGAFPTVTAFGHGVFDSLALNAVVPGSQNLSDVSAALTPPWVTSTVAGPFWADGGFPVLIPGVAITGFLSAGGFAMARRTRSLRWSMAAAYLLYLVVFGLYSNLWTQSIDWVVIVPLLLVVGAFVEDADSPPGLTGWVWARMKAVSRSGPAEAETKTVETPSERPSRRDRSVAKGLVVAGLGLLALLLVSGWAIQRLLPEPYPRIGVMRLAPSASAARESMTNSDLTSDNQPLYWVTTHGARVELSEFEPVAREAKLVGRATIPGLTGKTTFDIGSWPPWRNLALFSFSQGPSRLSITIAPTNANEAQPVEFSAPIAPASEGATNKFMIATWGGSMPDLFIVSQGATSSRATIRVLSGESGFRRQLFVSRLPFRGLSQADWSLDIGQLATIPKEDANRSVIGARPDLLLIHHEAGLEHSSLEVLLGESGFLWDAFRRDLDTPGDLPAGTEFLLGTDLGATAVYQVDRHEPEGPRLQIFGLEAPPQFR